MKNYNESGKTLIIVIVLSTVLTIGSLALFPFLIQSQSTETRLYHQQQVIQLAQSTMNSYINHKGTFLNGPLYTGSQPRTITLPDQSELSLYAYAMDYNGHILEEIQHVPSTYEFVVEVFYGDENNNKHKDNGEQLFYTKRLAVQEGPQDTEVKLRFNVISFNGSTLTLNVFIQPSYGELEVHRAYRETNSEKYYIRTNDQPLNVSNPRNRKIDSEKNEVSYTVDIPDLKNNDTICLRAKAGSLTGECQYLTLQEGMGNGLVIKIIDGQYIYLPITNTFETEGKLIVTSGVGDFSTNESILYSARLGIEVEQNVLLEMSANGQGTIKLESSEGDIVIRKDSTLDNHASGNNIEYRMELYAPNGIIDIRDAHLISERSIVLTGKSIYTDRAHIEVDDNNENVHFEFSEYLRVPDLTIQLFKSRGNATSNPTNIKKICGTLKEGTLNNISNFGTCPNLTETPR